MDRVAIIVGHTKEKQGAYSRYLDQTEFEFNSTVAEELSDVADIYYYKEGGYSDRVDELSDRINSQNYSLVIELHFNSFYDSAVGGTEVLFWHKNKNGRKLAKYLSKEISTSIGTKNRGEKGITRFNRGGLYMEKINTTTLLLEPFFGSNHRDSLKFKNKCNFELYVNILRDFIKELKSTKTLKVMSNLSIDLWKEKALSVIEKWESIGKWMKNIFITLAGIGLAVPYFLEVLVSAEFLNELVGVVDTLHVALAALVAAVGKIIESYQTIRKMFLEKEHDSGEIMTLSAPKVIKYNPFTKRVLIDSNIMDR